MGVEGRRGRRRGKRLGAGTLAQFGAPQPRRRDGLLDGPAPARVVLEEVVDELFRLAEAMRI